METKSGSSSMVSNRSTSSSRLSRPGSAVDLLLERMGAIHADLQGNIGAAQAETRNSIEAIHADIGAVQANMGAIHADLQGNIGAVGVAQVETREVLETVIHRLERLEASPVPKFVAGLDRNPSLSDEMTAAPTHSSISLEVKQGNPEVSTAPVVLRRSERLINKPKVDYRQVAFLPRWPTATTVSSNPCPEPTLYSSSSFAALQQHANPSAFETVPATLVERGRNVTIGTRSGVRVRISEDGLGQGREIVEEIELDSDEEFNTALDIETLPRTYDLEYKNVGRSNLTGNGPDFINESGVVRTQIRSPRPTLPHAASPVRSQSEPRMSHQVADGSTSVLLGRPQPTTVRPVGVSERREDAPHTPRYMGNVMPHPTRPAFLLESQAPATCCYSGCLSNLPMSSFAFASTPYSYPGAQSTLGRPAPDSVPRTFCETAVGNSVEWTIANGRGLGQNAFSGAQRYGWKREPYCPPYQTTPWVRSNDTQGKIVVMTSVATQTTGDEEVIVKGEGKPLPQENKTDSTATTGSEKELESANLPSRPKQFIKLGSYDGRTQVEAFIRKFTICGKNNGWTDEEK